MNEEKDDIEFKELLAARQHKEVISSLGNIAKLLQKEDGNGKIVEAVQQQIKSIEQLFKNIPQPEKPEVKVEVNQEAVIQAINDSKKEMSAKIETLNQTLLALIAMQMKERDFKIKRNNNGYLDSISVTVKN
jgi:hypothetical protein